VGLDRVVHVRVNLAAFRAFAGLASEMGLALIDVAALAGDASCAIPLANLPDWEACRERLAAELGDRVELERDCAVVSVVGEGLTAGTGLLGEMLDVIARIGAETRAVHAGPLRMAATLRADRLRDAQQALHAAFVVPSGPPERTQEAAGVSMRGLQGRQDSA
jgi:hypothetical protein